MLVVIPANKAYNINYGKNYMLEDRLHNYSFMT